MACRDACLEGRTFGVDPLNVDYLTGVTPLDGCYDTTPDGCYDDLEASFAAIPSSSASISFRSFIKSEKSASILAFLPVELSPFVPIALSSGGLPGV